MAHVLPRDAFVNQEAVFGEDLFAPGTGIKIITPEFERAQALDENENITPRRYAVLDKIKGLKSDSTLACGMYFTAAGATAADQATAVATIQSTVLLAGLGGRVLGMSAALDGGGSAAAPSVTTDPGFVNGDWVFAYDTSEATGSWHKIDDASATPVLTLLNALPAAPDAADIFHAAITVFSNELNHDHTAAGYTTLGWWIQGEHTEDVQVFMGCKPTVSLEGYAAGERLKFQLDHMVLDWPDVEPVKVVAPAGPSGIAPVTVGTGVATTIQLGTVGGALANIDCRGTTEIDLGVTWAAVEGACGQEGVKGYVSEITPATVTIRVAFSDIAFLAEFIAGTHKHMLITVGDQPGNSTAIYFGDLEYDAVPMRVDEGSVTTTELVFRAHEDPGAVGVLTGDDLAQRRAPFVLLSAA